LIFIIPKNFCLPAQKRELKIKTAFERVGAVGTDIYVMNAGGGNQTAF